MDDHSGGSCVGYLFDERAGGFGSVLHTHFDKQRESGVGLVHTAHNTLSQRGVQEKLLADPDPLGVGHWGSKALRFCSGVLIMQC